MSNTAPTRPKARLDPGGGLPSIVLVSSDSVVAKLLPPEGAVTIGRGSGAGVRVEAPGVSRLHAEVVVDGQCVTIRDLGSSNGTIVNGEQLTESGPIHELSIHDIVELGDVILMFRDPRQSEAGVSGFERSAFLADEIVSTGGSVLLVGDRGIGKATLAHEIAVRHADTVLELDCSRLNARELDDLANYRDGIVVMHGIDAIRPARQKVVRAILPHARIPVISTSCVDLESQRRGARQLDEHLERRLGANEVLLPSLRDDRLRLDALCDELVMTLSESFGRKPLELSNAARGVLWTYAWPENVRELKEVMERTVRAHTGGPDILPADLRLGREHQEALEKATIEGVLTDCGGNQTLAARRLGISRRTLVSRLDKYSIVRPRKGRPVQ